MNYEAAKFWMEAVLIIINLGLWLFVWNSNRNQITRERINKLENDIENRFEAHSEQLGRIDERLKASVGHPELKPIYDRVNNVSEQISEINGKLHTLDLIHEMLLHGGGK